MVSGEESCGVWRRELWCLEKRVVVSGEESCGVWRRELCPLEEGWTITTFLLLIKPTRCTNFSNLFLE